MVLSQHFLRWLLNFWKLNDSTDIIHFVGLISSELMFELDLITMNLSPTRTIWPYFGDFSLHHNTPKRPHLVHLKILRYFSKTQRIFLFISTGFFHFQQNWHITNGIFNLWPKAFIDSHDIAYANSVLCHPLLKVLYELCLRIFGCPDVVVNIWTTAQKGPLQLSYLMTIGWSFSIIH